MLASPFLGGCLRRGVPNSTYEFMYHAGLEVEDVAVDGTVRMSICICKAQMLDTFQTVLTTLMNLEKHMQLFKPCD